MKYFLILVLWCTVNIVTSEEQNVEKHQSAENYVDPIQEPLRLTSFENLGKDYGLNPPPSSFEIEGIFMNILKFYICSIRMAYDSHSSIQLIKLRSTMVRVI